MKKIGSAAALVALLAAGCGTSTGVANVATTAREATVYTYEVAGNDFRLYPERVVVKDTGDPVVDAVTALVEHEPARRWLHTSWRDDYCAPAIEVTAVRQTPDLITVDLVERGPEHTGLAVCDMTQEGAAIRIQQMVWTVQKATRSDAPVRVMVGGEPFASATQAHRRFAPVPVLRDQNYRLPDAPGYQ